MCGAGCDQHVAPFQRSVRQGCIHGGDNLGHLGHAPGPEFTAGHRTLVRAYHQNPVALQHGQVAPCCRMLPHAHVHGRCDQHPLVGRHQQGRGQVIGQPIGHLRHEVGGSGGHDHEIGRAAEFDMPHLRLVGQVEEIAIDFLGRQRRGGQRRHELFARAGQNRNHRRTLVAQTADQIERLEGRDTAADDQKDALVRQHGASAHWSSFPLNLCA